MVRFYSGHMFTYSGFKYNYVMSRYARKRRVVQLRCYHAEREDAGEGEGRGIKRGFLYNYILYKNIKFKRSYFEL